ncbi:MAG: hypothetical protein ACOYD5_11860 [Negativicutes bacterium]
MIKTARHTLLKNFLSALKTHWIALINAAKIIARTTVKMIASITVSNMIALRTAAKMIVSRMIASSMTVNTTASMMIVAQQEVLVSPTF